MRVRVSAGLAQGVPTLQIDTRLDAGESEYIEPGSGVRALLRGVLYGHGAGDHARLILERYRKKGPEGVGSLEGSYLAVIVDPGRGVTAITDPLATRKGFFAVSEGSTILASSPTDLVDPWPGVSLAGVASHLSCNGTHGGLTPMAGVEMVPPGSVGRLTPTGVEVEAYHRWDFRGVESHSRSELRDQMIELMRAAVVDRLDAGSAETALLSLSGGYDSRGLLGFLSDRLGPSSVTAFTYHHGEAVGDMDRDAATRLAELAGVRHRVVEGYRGDFMAVLEHNARRGWGIAHFCDEADVWRELEGDEDGLSHDVLVVGDRQAHHMWLGKDLSIGEALSVVSVRPPSGIEWFLSSLPADTADGLRGGWSDRLTQVQERIDHAGSWQEALMEAYFVERVAYTLNLWREMFGGVSMAVANPFLDMRLLEFVARLPLELNDADAGLLHKEAIAAVFPRFEAVPATSGGWNRPHWGVEMARDRDRISSMLRAESSPLDEVVPPDVILRLLERVAASPPKLSEANSGLGWQFRKMVKRSPAARGIVRARRRRAMAQSPSVPAHEVLLRVLYLRRALTILGQGGDLGSAPRS